MILFPLIYNAASLQAQEPVRYLDKVFSKVKREKNIVYGDNSAMIGKSHLLDIYTPVGDSLKNRPVIVMMHGGGFKLGSKNNSRMHTWGEQFARKGFVFVALNYRLSKKHPLSRFEDLAEACIDASEDATAAVRYLRGRAEELDIDTSLIILGGHSAGGIIALQNVYSSRVEINRQIGRNDSAGVPIHNPAGVAGIINFWGAIFDTAWLANASIPIVSVHGSKDRVVPYEYRPGSSVFGSGAIHQTADRLGIPNALKTYPGLGHELQRHFDPIYAGPVARKRWREAGDFAAAFIYKQLLSGKSMLK